MSILKAGRPTKKDKIITQLQEVKEETIRMNINVPKAFYKQIKQQAFERDITITNFVIDILRNYICKQMSK